MEFILPTAGAIPKRWLAKPHRIPAPHPSNPLFVIAPVPLLPTVYCLLPTHYCLLSRVQSQEVGCRDTARCRIVPDAPEYGASAPSAAPAATWQFIARRKRKPAAIDAPALKRRTTDGTEVPYSGAPAVRESGTVLPTNILGLHPTVYSLLSTDYCLPANPRGCANSSLAFSIFLGGQSKTASRKGSAGRRQYRRFRQP
jgi:hypothetical protein